MIISKPLVCEYFISFFNLLVAPTNTAGIRLCIGDMPTDAELETLTQSSARINNNVALTYNTVGLTYMLKDANWPPQYIVNQFPNPSASAALTGTLGWGVFYHPTANVVTICDVSLTNGPGMITVDSLDVVPGKTITITGISMQVGRA